MRHQVETATKIGDSTSPALQPYNGPLNPQQIWEDSERNPEGWRRVPYDPNRLDVAPGPSCVEGLVVCEKKDGETSPNIGVVVEHASLTNRVIIRVASMLDGRLRVHPIDLSYFGKPLYFLVEKSSPSPP